MNRKVAELREKVTRVGEVQYDFDMAARVSPKTLRRNIPAADIWHVRSEDAKSYAGSIKERAGFLAAIESLTDYLLGRLEKAAEVGISTLVLDEPVFCAEVFMTELRKHLLKKTGLQVSIGRVSRHRYCPHMNSRSRKCLDEDEFDGGVGDISPLYLKISLPPAA